MPLERWKGHEGMPFTKMEKKVEDTVEHLKGMFLINNLVTFQ